MLPFPAATLAAASDARTGRDLASVLADLASGGDGLAILGGVGAVLFLLGTVVVTSAVRHRPAVPPDAALEERDPPRREEGPEVGVRDAQAMRFRDVDDVVETLARVSLAPAASWRDGGELVVELPATGSSRDASRERRPVCRWEVGFLQEGLRRFAAGRVEVKEVACRATGAPACRFVARGV